MFFLLWDKGGIISVTILIYSLYPSILSMIIWVKLAIKCYLHINFTFYTHSCTKLSSPVNVYLRKLCLLVSIKVGARLCQSRLDKNLRGGEARLAKWGELVKFTVTFLVRMAARSHGPISTLRQQQSATAATAACENRRDAGGAAFCAAECCTFILFVDIGDRRLLH